MSAPVLKRLPSADDIRGVTVFDTTTAPVAARADPGTTGDPAAPTGLVAAAGPGVPDGLGATDGPAAVGDLDERGLRALRASLVEETLRLRRWQRLVQARLDLATDRLSPAEALHGPVDLAALVRDRPGGADAADDLRAVVLAHRALRAQALALAARLSAVEGALAARGPSRRCCARG